MWFLKGVFKLIKKITKRVSFELLYMFRGLFTSLFNFFRMYFMGTFIKYTAQQLQLESVLQI